MKRLFILILLLTSMGSFAQKKLVLKVPAVASVGGGASLPDQTGNAGKYLTTDGTNASWAAVSGGTPSVYAGTDATLSMLTTVETYVFTGSSTATWTLPSLGGDVGRRYFLKNRGSAALTVQRTSTDQLYTSSPVNSITILPGGSFVLQNDGSYWIVID